MKKNILNIISRNVISLSLIELFLGFMYLGYRNLDMKVFVVDLRVFSALLLFLSIYIIEKAYKKDSGIMAITGIEVLVLAIITLVLPYAYYGFEGKIVNLSIIAMISFLAYYVLKILIHSLSVKLKK